MDAVSTSNFQGPASSIGFIESLGFWVSANNMYDDTAAIEAHAITYAVAKRGCALIWQQNAALCRRSNHPTVLTLPTQTQRT